MTVIDVAKQRPSLASVLDVARRGDVLLTRNGHAVALVEKFTDQDLEDWRFEHDPEVLRQTKAARERFRRGEGETLEQVMRDLRLSRTRRK